jgi:hypothetical protein
MAKKFSRFLTRYVRKLRFLHFLILLIVAATIIFFSIRIKNLEDFINDFATTKTEWSPSEHNSFLSMIIAEINRSSGEDENTKKREHEIEEFLREIKNDIEKISVEEKAEDTLRGSKDINIDLLEYNEVLKYLSKQKSKYLSLEELNLKMSEILDTDEQRRPTSGRPVLRNDDRERIPKSFVLIPTQLVHSDENNKPVLPLTLKCEVVFSKIVEKYLLRILERFPEGEQSYFISSIGFIRICPNPKKTSNPIEWYRDKFSYKQNFSDRTYFDLTIRDTFHASPPYVDTGGFGIVRTYSIAILNQDLKVVGIIAVDIMTEKSIESLLKKSSVGPTAHLFKNFFIDFSENLTENELKTSKNLLSDEEKREFINKGKSKLAKKVNRVDNKDRIIYSVPIQKNKVAFVIFDKDKFLRNTLLFGLITASLLIMITLLIFFIYKQNIKRMKAEEDQLKLISHMRSSYVITDKGNSIFDYNEEFESLVEEKNLKGENFENYLTEDSLKDFKYHMEQGKEKFECPIEIKGQKGTRKPALLINTKTEHPYVKNSRISIIIESENLESMVAEKYLDRISHVLKTPLHSILLIADQLRRKSARPRYDDYFILLNSSITELGDAIARYLRISKVEFKYLKPDFEKFDLSKLANEISKGFEQLAERKKLEFHCNFAQGVTILGDRNMIKVAIENILDNALKYTIQGKISINLFDDLVNAKIVIEDTGIGIPDDEHELIFKKRYRSDHPLVKQNDGHGIGLYQSMQFIRLNGGKIHVHSVSEVGSKFTIILPKKDKS